MKEVLVKCDVLVAGGGIAGLMAAIKARELGAKVVVAEKGNTLRSGAGGAGNDHFQCYIPEVHGDWSVFWRGLFFGQQVGNLRMMDKEYIEYWFRNTYDIVKLWDSWGIPMKYEGKYDFAGHGFPGEQLNHLKYSGMNQKPVLTEQANKVGADIMNRVMVFDTLQDKDGKIVGALGVSTRDDTLYVFQSKAVIVGTGGVGEMYPALTTGANYNRAWPGNLSGDGRMMALKAGASVKALEMVGRHAGPKYFIRAGQATWVGVLRDRNGKPVGPFVTKPDKEHGDMTIETNKGVFDEYNRKGTGPIYMDMNGINDADLEYMVYWLKMEGNGGLLQGITDDGVDLKKSAVEFQTFEMALRGGIKTNYKAETGVKGLYASGDDVEGSISHAAIFGRSAGENAVKYGKTATGDFENAKAKIKETKAMLEEFRGREDGATPFEAESALQQVMFDYCGMVRSQTLLEAGYDVIRKLKAKAKAQMLASNPHELARCLQVMNRIELGELTFLMALDRKESRDWHKRTDYTLTNPLLSDKLHTVKMVKGKPVVEWVEIKGW